MSLSDTVDGAVSTGARRRAKRGRGASWPGQEVLSPDWVDGARDLAHVYYLDEDMRVRDATIGQVHVVHTYDTLRKAAGVLVDHHVGAVPVLDKTESLVGMLSAVDLLRALSDMIDQR